MEESGIELKALAAEMQLSVKALNAIIKGKSPITREIAILLESALKTPATFWLRREKQYQEFLAGQQPTEKLKEEEAHVANNAPSIKRPATPAIAHHRL